MLLARAPAKINLTLHVLRRRADGFHDLESLVAFAGVGDILELHPGDRSTLRVRGPTAEAAGTLGDNLVVKAARNLGARVPGLKLGSFVLTKRLPVGAGIGGGSSDAAAALRLLAELNGLALDDGRLRDAARETGADVPVCLQPRSRMMRGTGERLGPRLGPRPLFAILVNPGVHLDTRAVFARMGLKPGQEMGLEEHPAIHDELDRDSYINAVLAGRNDMQRAASHLAPVIHDVVDALARTENCRVARMSGSGSTCFGLFATRSAARGAAASLRQTHSNWWIRATALG